MTTPNHLHIVYGFFCIQLQSWVVVKVDDMACKAEIFTVGSFKKKIANL